FVVLVNACMNLPAGFTMEAGRPVGIDPLAAMFSPPWRHETLHALLACYQATAFAMSGVHAAVLLRHPTSSLYRKAFSITLAMASVTALLQPLSGDMSARAIAEQEPAKLAAAEAHFETGAHAPLVVGGLADADARETHGAIRVPSGLSILAHRSPNAVVTGL